MIAPLARLGYASKALIYAIVGYLAIAAAMNRGGRVTDTSGALRVVPRESTLELANAADGRWLLGLVASGLLAYAVDQALHARYRRIRPVV